MVRVRLSELGVRSAMIITLMIILSGCFSAPTAKVTETVNKAKDIAEDSKKKAQEFQEDIEKIQGGINKVQEGIGEIRSVGEESSPENP